MPAEYVTVEYKKSWVHRLYVPAIFKGMMVTLKHMFQKRFTVNYPEEKLHLPEGYRGLHLLFVDDEGREKCTACFMCATACPANCIRIVAEPSGWSDREKRPKIYEIDELRCIYCGMCVEACPCEALGMTDVHNLSSRTREEMLYNKEMLIANNKLRVTFR
ncbi:NuoI/complex I 23 kDa subunit family protein [candidate division KSB1 bacterium]